MLETILTVASAVAAIVAAGLWIWSAKASVPAPENTSGVGGLLGGYLVGKDARGNRIDLIGTATKQSSYSAYAAIAAMVSALLSAASSVAHVLGK